MEAIQAVSAQAGVASLKPILLNYHSKLTMRSIYLTSDKTTTYAQNDSSSRRGFRESLDLSTAGYVYHPNLMFFNLEGGYGQDQTRLTANGVQTDQQGGFDSYEMRTFLLKAKPYNMEVYTLKEKEFATSEKVSEQDREITHESGAKFNFRKQGYTAKLGYENLTRVDGDNSRATDNYDLIGNFQKPKIGSLEDFTAMAVLRYQDNSGTTLGEGWRGETSTDGQLYNSFAYKIFDFSTDISSLSTDLLGSSEEAQAAYANDLLTFREGITAELPWDFTSRVLLMADRGTTDNSLDALGSESSRDNDKLSFDLTQKLYRSLETKLLANVDSSQNRGVRRIDNIEAVTSGETDRREYGLESRYQKILPFSSQGTGFVSSRNTQTSRLGLNVEYDRFVASEEAGVVRFQLAKDTDTEGMTIEVLKENPDKLNSACKSAFENPQAAFPNCWISLSVEDYLLTKSIDIDKSVVSTITLDVINLRSLPGFDYASFDNGDGTFDPFPFRVRRDLRAVDATVQTNSLGAGLTLFDLVSSNYTHSVTAQEGNYAGFTLQPEVVDDRINLRFFRQSFSAGISQQWIRALGDEAITDMRTSYDKTMKFFERMTVVLGANAYSGRGEAIDSLGSSSSSSEQGYTYSLDATTPVPYIGATFRAGNKFSYSKGSIVRLALTRDGVMIPSQDLGIDDRTVISNSVGLSKPFTIPWIKFGADSFVRYEWETTSGEENRKSSRLQYGANARRSWRLGATMINLDARYANNERSVDGGVFFRNIGERTVSEERDNTFMVMLTVVRQLF